MRNLPTTIGQIFAGLALIIVSALILALLTGAAIRAWEWAL